MVNDLYWPVGTIVMAIAQGLLLPTLRTVPLGTTEAKRNNYSLHYVLLAAWALPVLLAPASWLAALLSRAVLFDPAINAASGKPLFYVGSTAATDRALNWLALRVHLSPDRLRAVAWIVAVVAALGFYFMRLGE